MSKHPQTKGDQCAEWLVRLLDEGGPLKPQTVGEMGKQAGYSRAMIYRVRERLPQIVDMHGRKHPENLWLLDPEYVPPPKGRSAEEQLAVLNDWLAEHDPETYLETPGMDTAATIIVVLERKLSPSRLVAMLARELGV